MPKTGDQKGMAAGVGDCRDGGLDGEASRTTDLSNKSSHELLLTIPQAGRSCPSNPDVGTKKHLTPNSVDRATYLSREEWEAYKAWSRNPGEPSMAEGLPPLLPKASMTAPLRRTVPMKDDTQEQPRKGRSIIGLPLLSPLAMWYYLWTQWILLLDMTYVAFLVPIIIGFQLDDVNFSWSCIVDLIAGFVYVVELVLNFHVGIVGKFRSEHHIILDGRKIAMFYIRRGTFLIDFLTGVAWFIQVGLIIRVATGQPLPSGIMAMYQGVRVLRLLRLSSLITRLLMTFSTATTSLFENYRMSQTQMYSISLVYTAAVLVNLLSSIWNFVAIAEGFNPSWVNYFPVLVRQYGSADSQAAGSLTPAEAANVPAAFRYLLGVYYSIVTLSTIGYGDLTPSTQLEYSIAIIFIVVSVVFFTMLIGSIGEALSRFSRNSQRASSFRQRMESVDVWMVKRRLPRTLRNNIIQYYAEEWLRDVESVEEVGVVEELPHSLRREVALTVNAPLFERFGLFAGPDFAVLRPIITSFMSPSRLQPGVEICNQGAPAESLWLLHEGEVARIDTQLTECEVVPAPAVLGLSALLQDRDPQYASRPYSYRCMSSCLVWELPLRDVMPLLRHHPDLMCQLEDAAAASHSSTMVSQASLLAGIKTFYGSEHKQMVENVQAHSLVRQASNSLLLKREGTRRGNLTASNGSNHFSPPGQQEHEHQQAQAVQKHESQYGCVSSANLG